MLSKTTSVSPHTPFQKIIIAIETIKVNKILFLFLRSSNEFCMLNMHYTKNYLLINIFVKIRLSLFLVYFKQIIQNFIFLFIANVYILSNRLIIISYKCGLMGISKRNILLIALLILIIGVVLFLYQSEVTEKPQEALGIESAFNQLESVFSNNGYSMELFAKEKSLDSSYVKMSTLRDEINELDFSSFDENVQALKEYYYSVVELKMREKKVIQNLQKYSFDESLVCENLEYLMQVDVNMSALSADYSGLVFLKHEYLSEFDEFVVDLNSDRYVLASELYSDYFEYVFSECMLNVVDDYYDGKISDEEAEIIFEMELE